MYNKCMDKFSEDFVIRNESRRVGIRNKNEFCNEKNNHFFNIVTKLNNDLPSTDSY